jgi:hypothetical protein
VVAVLFFFEVAQEVADHRIHHANIKQTKKIYDVVIVFEGVSCRQRECNTELVVPVYHLYEAISPFDCNV